MIHCLLCESSTLEESLLEHLQYNHMVYKKTLRNVLHSLHFPPVDQQLLDRLATECENEAAIAPTRNHNNLTPFARRKRSVSKVHLDNFLFVLNRKLFRKMEGDGRRVLFSSPSV